MVEWKTRIWDGDKGTRFESSEKRSDEATLIHIFFGMMIGAMASEVIPKYMNSCGMDGTMMLSAPQAKDILDELGITISVDEVKMKQFCKNFRASDGTAI